MLPIVHELGRTRLEVNVKLKANFSAKLFAVNLLVTVPVPDNTARAEIHTSLGARPSCSLYTGPTLLCACLRHEHGARRYPHQPRRARPASAPFFGPCCVHDLCARAISRAHAQRVAEGLGIAALRRARLLQSMPACAVHRPGVWTSPDPIEPANPP